MQTKKIQFYDAYHQKNDRFYKVIGRNNFTYFFILNALEKWAAPFKKKQILDVGCGVGTISLYLAKQGAQVTGVDVSERAIFLCNEAKKALVLKNVQFLHQEVAHVKEKFDIILCLEVIEHIEDDTKFLHQLTSRLKPNGLLFLSTPSKENFLYKKGKYQKFDAEVGHVRRYTDHSLHSLLKGEQLTILDFQKNEGILRNTLYFTKMGKIIRFIRGPFVSLFHFFDALSISIFGEADFLVVAQKKV